MLYPYIQLIEAECIDKKRVRLTCLPARPQGCVCAIRRQGREQPKRKVTR